MKLQTSLGIALVVALGGTTAHADVERKLEVVTVDPQLVDHVFPNDANFAAPQSRIIYLNRCAGGCTIYHGNDSAVNNTSAITGVGVAQFSAFSYGDAAWNALVQCVKSVYAPFNITVTDQRPTSGVYWMNIVAGTAAQGGFDQGILGVSPGTGQCPMPLLNNTVTFTFANDPLTSSDTNYLCWIAAQETAHSFGLDHEALQLDAMTYIGLNDSTPPRHSFRDVNGACGANQAGDSGCYCPSVPQQNSYQRILSIFGGSGPTPPVVTITSPANGVQVNPGFQVQATIQDDNGVASASLVIDGVVGQTSTIAPFIFAAPSDLAGGTHHVVVQATDTQGTQGSAAIDVIIGAPCETPGDCAAQGDNLTCVGGRCVPGEGTPGGLGTTCDVNTDCFSGNCQHDAQGNSFCVEACNVDANDCPSGYGCIASGSSGVCWPGAGGVETGGCQSGGGAPTLPIGLGLGVGLLVVRRRRR